MTENQENIFNIDEILKEFENCNTSFASQLEIILDKKRVDNYKAVQILDRLLEREDKPDVLLLLVKKLGSYRCEIPTKNLVDILLNKNGADTSTDIYLKLRCMISTLLGNIKDQNTVVPMLYVLNNKDENYKLRLNIAESLGRLGNKYAVAPLIDIVTDEEERSIYVRESAAKALGMLGDIQAIEPFVKILESKNGIIDKFTFLKEKVIEAIAALGNKNSECVAERRTVKALISALVDESPAIRLGAIDALSEVDNEEVLELIKERIYDEEEEVARGAIDALYNMRGLDYIKEFLDEVRLPGWCRDEIEILMEEDEEGCDE